MPPYTMREFFAPFYPRDAKNRFIAMFRAYFDDSGQYPKDRILTVGGVLASDEQYDLLKPTWDAILERNHLPYFHTTKLKAGKVLPYSAMSEYEKETLLDQLVRLMSVRVRMSFSCAVPVADYDAVLTAEEKQRYGSPYAWAAQMCWIIIRLWAEQHDYNDPIPFVVECGTTGEEHLSAIFNKVAADPTMKRLYRLDSLVLHGKEGWPGLQAADIMANSAHDLATDYIAGGRAHSKWMEIIAPHIKKMDNHQIIASEKILRDELEMLNEYQQSEGTA